MIYIYTYGTYIYIVCVLYMYVYCILYMYCICIYNTMYILIVYLHVLSNTVHTYLWRGVAIKKKKMCRSETNKERDCKGLSWWEDAWVLHQSVWKWSYWTHHSPVALPKHLASNLAIFSRNWVRVKFYLGINGPLRNSRFFRFVESTNYPLVN